LLAGGIAAVVAAQPPDPKPPDPPKAAAKEAPKSPAANTVRLPDGTLLWTGSAPADADRVWISPQDLQKLSDQADRLKKQLAARKPAAPSGCAVRGRIETRGDTSVAVLKAVLTVRTTEPNATVALGGKRAFLVAATLDGDKTPVLEATDDGFAAALEAAGDHTVTLELEAPVAGRGAKAEVGFELGLPKAPITTLALDPPAGVGRVNLAAKLPDPPSGKSTEPRRVAGLDSARLAPRPDGGGYPLGPVEAVEVTWDPPAATPPADAARSAEVDVAVQFTAESVETTAKVRPRGANRTWKVATPAGATLTADRATPTRDTTAGTAEAATVGKPADPAKPVWTVELPPGAAAADWVFTVVHRADRPPPADPGYAGPYSVGPVAVLDAVGQTGTVKLTAPTSTRLVVRGAGVRQVEPAGPPDPGEVVAAYRLAAGQTGADYPAAPLLTVEARPLAGAVEVRPAYQLALTDAGWRVRAELKVVPIRREVDAVRIDLPADWQNPGVTPPELVEGVQPGPAAGGRQGLLVKLAAGHRGPFTLTLTATAPAGGPVQFPRFPDAAQRDATVTATVPDGQEVRGTGREWDGDQPAHADQPLASVPGPDGRP
ncbi:MAG: hypothetical protein K2X87_11035, partial [Gemmataceae bacterium]|nr:hypothetical protein [Gemmataceae bacterium]